MDAVSNLLPAALRLLRVSGLSVTVGMTMPMSIAERGHLLLETEKRLRGQSGQPYEVFLEPKADRNALRLLRGVTVE